jgi:hypothetical protein
VNPSPHNAPAWAAVVNSCRRDSLFCIRMSQ